MNNTIKLAVAGAVLSAASMANAGIIIPAGDWTLDINGNVNAYATIQEHDTEGTVTGGLMAVYGTGSGSSTEDSNQSINTGLLPAWLGFTGTTRQNDTDVSFTISFQPNVSDNGATGDSKQPLNRQAFLTFGDASWGSVKMGKDIGIFASDAILNDMTLLGVGGGFNNSGMSTTTGGIGTGYIYAAWKGQFAYTTPNMNGFQATLGITNPNQVDIDLGGSAARQDGFGIEGKASYTMPMGKVWVSGASYKVTGDGVAAVFGTGATAAVNFDITVFDIGTTLNFGNAAVTAYYYNGEGAGNGVLGFNGADANGNERDSDGGYIQATYVVPTGTKLGVAYGVTRLDQATATDTASLVDEQSRWTVGAYHPLTKHLNLVAEYNSIEEESHNNISNEADAISLGAILFF
jgi:predicted porin